MKQLLSFPLRELRCPAARVDGTEEDILGTGKGHLQKCEEGGEIIMMLRVLRVDFFKAVLT